jgi:pilus assembly protein Flp/PilA
MIRRFLSDDAGQGLVEYALIIALVSIVCIAALSTLGMKVDNSLDNAANNLS